MARLISGFEAVLRHRQGVLFSFGVLCVRPLIQNKPTREASPGHNSWGPSVAGAILSCGREAAQISWYGKIGHRHRPCRSCPCWWQVPARNRQLAGRGACTADEIVKHVHALAGCTRTSWEGREYVLQAVGRIMRGLPEFTNL